MRSPSVLVAALSIALVAATSLAAGAPAGAAALPASSKATSTVPDGRTIPKTNVTTNGRTWKQTFRAGFDSAAPVGKFAATYPRIGLYDGFTDTTGKGKYAPSKVLSVKGGVLDFALHTEKGQPLVAAIMPDGYAPHKTGRVSIRYKTTKTQGYKFSTILWPSSDDWNEGEIDWPEGDLTGDVRPVSAIPGSYDPTTEAMTFLPEDPTVVSGGQTDWHVATVEWTADAVRFYWDDELLETVTGAVPTTPMRVTLQAETIIHDAEVPADASGHVLVDWVVAYRKSRVQS
jgi:beta-glucanase (GH16 family)